MSKTTEALNESNETSTPKFEFTQYLTDNDVVCINYRGMTIIKPVSEIVKALESPEPRLVSYAPDGSTCTLNINGEEVYFNRESQEQEPVAWRNPNDDDRRHAFMWHGKPRDKGKYTIPLYTHPAQPLTKEWIGTALERADKDEAFRKGLIGELAQPLSAVELSNIFIRPDVNGDATKFARAIEAAHGIGVKDGTN